MFMNIVLPFVFVGGYVYAGCCWRGTRSDVFTRGIAMCDVSLFLWAMLWGLGSFFGVVFSFSDSVYCAHRFYLWRFFALRCVVFCCVSLRFVAFCCVLLRFLTCARTYCEDLLMHRIWNNLKAIAKVGMRAPIPFNSDVCNISKEVHIEHKLHINNIVYKWNYAVQSCVWAKLYVGSEACMLAFDTHWEVIVGRARSLDRI